MANAMVPASELLYEETFQMGRTAEYGLGMADVLSGKVKLPPQGGRFDVSVAGEITGSRLAGSITAVDYVTMRADGSTRLHVHGEITTKENDKVSFFADGTFAPGAPAQLRENVTLYSACPRYEWVSQLQVWATGPLDLATGKAQLAGYAA